MPKACALALFSWASESRNVHSSFVQTEVNAAGKNARTVVPLANSAASVTGCAPPDPGRHGHVLLP
jgi:hypothetical protein